MNSRRVYLSIILFSFFVLVYTFNDKIVHNDLYRYGLQFNDAWAVPYWINYFLMYELAIIALTLVCKNKWFFLLSNIFVIFTSQDIVYFLWAGYFPSGEWVWMWQYHVFGTWTTTLQLITSGLILTGIGAIGVKRCLVSQ